MSEEVSLVYAQIEECIATWGISFLAEWDLLVFLYRHQNCLLTVEQISSLLGYGAPAVGRALRALGMADLVRYSRSSHGILLNRLAVSVDEALQNRFELLLSLLKKPLARGLIARRLGRPTERSPAHLKGSSTVDLRMCSSEFDRVLWGNIIGEIELGFAFLDLGRAEFFHGDSRQGSHRLNDAKVALLTARRTLEAVTSSEQRKHLGLRVNQLKLAVKTYDLLLVYGSDLGCFPTEKQFGSHVTLTPHKPTSAGKPVKEKKRNRKLQTIGKERLDF